MKRLSLLLLVLLGCQASPAPAQSAPPQVCVANVWSGDAARGRLTSKLDDVETLGVHAVRQATGGNALLGEGVPRARAVADALRARRVAAVLQITYPRGLREKDLTEEAVYAGGAAWGPFLREYQDVYRYGVQVGNEANLKIAANYRNALAAGASEEEARQVAQEWSERLAMFVVSFAEGVHSVCPECRVATGGLGDLNGGRRQAAETYLAQLAPYVASGVVAPVLDIHIYRGRRFFSRDGSGRLRWAEGFEATVRDLLTNAGWPAATTLQSTEANVPADDGWPSDAARTEALEALLRGLFNLPRMNLVCVFSPWTESRNERWLISPGTPAASAVQRVAEEH